MRAKASTDQSFFLAGDCTDPAYRNVRDNPHNNSPLNLTMAKALVESLWTRYRILNLADSNFLKNAQDDFHARFWEMYLAVTLSEQGFKLKKDRPDGPEFYFLHDGRKVWVEAVAPGPGSGADRVPNKRDSGKPPEEKILLRFTNALDNKKEQYSNGLNNGIIAPNDLYILAINSFSIPYGPSGDFAPYFVKAFLPIGPYVFIFDKNQNKFIFTEYQYYQQRENIRKKSGAEVQTTAGLERTFSFVSAVLHSGFSCLNSSANLGEDFSILHWPAAAHPLDPDLFHWCQQIFYQDGHLEFRPELK